MMSHLLVSFFLTQHLLECGEYVNFLVYLVAVGNWWCNNEQDEYEESIVFTFYSSLGIVFILFYCISSFLSLYNCTTKKQYLILVFSLRIELRKKVLISWIKVHRQITIDRWSCEKGDGYHQVDVDGVKAIVNVVLAEVYQILYKN